MQYFVMVMQLKLIVVVVVVVVGLSLDPIDRSPFRHLMKVSSLYMHCLLQISATFTDQDYPLPLPIRIKHCLYRLGLSTAFTD